MLAHHFSSRKTEWNDNTKPSWNLRATTKTKTKQNNWIFWEKTKTEKKNCAALFGYAISNNVIVEDWGTRRKLKWNRTQQMALLPWTSQFSHFQTHQMCMAMNGTVPTFSSVFLFGFILSFRRLVSVLLRIMLCFCFCHVYFGGLVSVYAMVVGYFMRQRKSKETK